MLSPPSPPSAPKENTSFVLTLQVDDRGTKDFRQAFRIGSPEKSFVVCPQNELHKRKWLKSFAHALRPYEKEKVLGEVFFV